MGSGAFLPAMTTRPAKGKSSGLLCGEIGAVTIGLWRHYGPDRDVVSCSSFGMDRDNESDEADRAISTGKLHALLRFHTRPIDVVVFHGSDREHWF